MKRRLLSLSLFMCLVVCCGAQSAPSQVMSTQGGFDKTSDYSLEWTLGETVATTSKTPVYIYTQGFNQSFIRPAQTKRTRSGAALVTVYAAPNPVTANLTVAIDAPAAGKYAIVLTNLFGVRVYERLAHPSGNTLSIPMTGVANGAYLLQVYDARKQLISATTIIKL